MKKFFILSFLLIAVLCGNNAVLAQGTSTPIGFGDNLPQNCNPNDKRGVLFYKSTTTTVNAVVVPLGLYRCVGVNDYKLIGGVGGGGTGGGNMDTATYDADQNGIIDNAQKLNGQLPSYYQNRAAHTGTQAQSTIDGLPAALNAKANTATYDTDANGVADNAQRLNGQLPTFYQDRSNQTGAQAISTVTGLQTALNSKANTATYDADGNGVADNAQQLGGNAPAFYLDRANQTGTLPQAAVAGLQSALDGKVNTSSLASVALTGAYGSLTGLPPPLQTNGDGTQFLANDGTFKAVVGGGGTVVAETDKTYYFAGSGNDANNCLTETTPCKTTTRAAQVAALGGNLVPKNVLFNNADTWTDTLDISEISGTAAAPVTFGSYGNARDADGSLRKPLFDLSKPFNATWTLATQTYPVDNYFDREKNLNGGVDRSNDWRYNPATDTYSWFNGGGWLTTYDPATKVSSLIASSNNEQHWASLFYYGVPERGKQTLEFKAKPGTRASSKLQIRWDMRDIPAAPIKVVTVNFDLVAGTFSNPQNNAVITSAPAANGFTLYKIVTDAFTGYDSTLVRAALLGGNFEETWTGAGGGGVDAYVTDARMYDGESQTLTPVNVYTTPYTGGAFEALTVNSNRVEKVYYPPTVFEQENAFVVWDNLIWLKLPNGINPNNLPMTIADDNHGVVGYNNNFVTVENLEVKNALYDGIVLIGGGHQTVRNNKISNSASGIGIYGNKFIRNAPAVVAPIVENNRIGYLSPRRDNNYDVAGIILRGANDAIIRNNTVATQTTMGITLRDWWFNVGGGTGDRGSIESNRGLITGNDISDSEGGISNWVTHDTVISYNKVHDLFGYGIADGGTPYFGGEAAPRRSERTLIAFNTVSTVKTGAFKALYNCLDINAGAKYGKIYFNVFENCPRHALTLEADFWQRNPNQKSNGWTIANNVFDQSRAPEVGAYNLVYLADGIDVNTQVFYNNLYVPNKRYGSSMFGQVGSRHITYDQWINEFAGITTNGVPVDTGSIKANSARFTNAALGDFTLQPDSPAVGAAKAIPGLAINYAATLPNIGVFDKATAIPTKILAGNQAVTGTLGVNGLTLKNVGETLYQSSDNVNFTPLRTEQVFKRNLLTANQSSATIDSAGIAFVQRGVASRDVEVVPAGQFSSFKIVSNSNQTGSLEFDATTANIVGSVPVEMSAMFLSADPLVRRTIRVTYYTFDGESGSGNYLGGFDQETLVTDDYNQWKTILLTVTPPVNARSIIMNFQIQNGAGGGVAHTFNVTNFVYHQRR